MDLDDLIKAKVGDQPFAYYLTVNEGLIYPNDQEEQSGYVVTKAGLSYFYWTGWDPRKNRVFLETWEPTAVDLFVAEENDEYFTALEKVEQAS